METNTDKSRAMATGNSKAEVSMDRAQLLYWGATLSEHGAPFQYRHSILTAKEAIVR